MNPAYYQIIGSLPATIDFLFYSRLFDRTPTMISLKWLVVKFFGLKPLLARNRVDYGYNIHYRFEH